MTTNPETVQTQAQLIIHSASASAAAVGAGLAFLPWSDNIPLTGIQMGMALALGKLFNIEMTDRVASGATRSVLASISGQVFTRAISQGVLGWVPVWGSALNATTAALLTEAVGWNLVQKFSEQDTAS